MSKLLNFNEYSKKVGLKVNQMFTGKISDTYGRTRVSSSKHRKGFKSVVVHTTANTAPAINEAKNIHNNNGINSFHAVADKDGVYETVRFQDVAHHAGNKSVNCESLGFELVDKDQAEGYVNFIKYVGYAMASVGIVPSDKTVLFHNQIVSTSCGRFLRDKGKAKVVSDIKKYYDIALNGDIVETKPQPKPEPKPQPKPKPQPAPKPQADSFKVVSENGYFKPNRKVSIKNKPLKAEADWGYQMSGDEFEYDAYTVNDGFIWVRSKKIGKWIPWRVRGGEKFGEVRLKGSKPAPKPQPKPKPQPAPKPQAKVFKVGQKVKVKRTAKKFSTGQNIDGWVKGSTFTVGEVGSKDLYLKEISSRVLKTDVE